MHTESLQGEHNKKVIPLDGATEFEQLPSPSSILRRERETFGACSLVLFLGRFYSRCTEAQLGRRAVALVPVVKAKRFARLLVLGDPLKCIYLE